MPTVRSTILRFAQSPRAAVTLCRPCHCFLVRNMTSVASASEDTIPPSYPYCWSPDDTKLSIDDFIKKYKPSMVQNDGTKPWLWVRNSNDVGQEGNKEAALNEATELLNEASERIKSINEDDSIPTRASKKIGKKSKKQMKDEVQAEYAEKLKKVHEKHGYKTGKWLAFISPETVDLVWSRLAVSVVTGPLSKTAAYVSKVATTPSNESSAQRIICVYMPDIFDKVKVVEVMKVLLRNHGLQLAGVKSDLYTWIGLDSKHPSHIQSTIWKNTDLIKDEEMKELRATFYAELKGDTGGASNDNADDTTAKKSTAKPKPVTDDPFGSDEDEDEPKDKKRKKSSGESKTDSVTGKPPSKKKKA